MKVKRDDNGGQPVEKPKPKTQFDGGRWVKKNQKPNFMTETWNIEGCWDVARNQTNPTMCQTLSFAWLKWEESGLQGELAEII
jgi:hypothetical protein